MGGRGSGSGGGGSAGGARLNLSGMQGSEKQIAYATDLLQGYLSTYDYAIKNIQNDIRYGENKEYTDLAKRTIKELNTYRNKEIEFFNTGIKQHGLKASTIIDRRSSLSPTSQATEEKILRKMGVSTSFSNHIPKRKK